MAIVKNANGNFNNKLGNVIYQYYNGRNIVRAKPLIYNDANTVVQQKNRQKFKNVSIIAGNLKSIIKAGYLAEYIGVRIGFFVKENLINGFVVDDYGVIFDYNKILISNGLSRKATTTATFNQPTNEITLDWSASTLTNAKLRKLYFNFIIFYDTLNNNKYEWKVYEIEAIDKSFVYQPYTEVENGQTIRVISFFSMHNGTKSYKQDNQLITL